MPKLTIDGVEIEAAQGQSVLDAALAHGIHIPHLCYHPRLKVSGNCRMCLVEIEKAPKLQISCGTEARDGMVVQTKSEKVLKARQSVLEFMLINHPLDCPTCDQCGECKLQDYCSEHGQEESRYGEEKHGFDVLDVGPDISRNMNRCIHCTRCIRFLRDVAGSEEFTLYERGSHTTVGPYLEKALESPFSGNLAEVCPVGALTCKHFRFKGRSWLMEKSRTLCPGCARGCNAYAWTSKQEVLRLTPAENDFVNQSWLCNAGRASIAQIEAKNRILEPTRATAMEELAGVLRALIEKDEGEKVGVLASPRLTNEDLYLIRKLAREVIGTTHLAFVPGMSDDRPFGPLDTPLTEWFIRADPTPNSHGARDILHSTEHTENAFDLIEAAEKGEISSLLVFSEDPVTSFGDVDRATKALGQLDFLAVIDSHFSPTAELARLVVPEASFAEKDGTFTNEQGRIQRLRAAIPARGHSQSAWQTVTEVAKHLGTVWTFNSAAEVDREIASKIPGYQDLDFDTLPLEGLALVQADEADQAEAEESTPDQDKKE